MYAAVETASPLANKHRIYAVWLVFAGIVGWWAAFELTLEKITLLTNEGVTLGCDYSLLVQCSANLGSYQGSIFGFPNPILGLTGWVAPIIVGVAILSGVRFPRWFMITFAAGITAAMIFVIWLISQSIFLLGTLCPWCMVTWAVTIPTFIATIFNLFTSGTIPLRPAGYQRVQRLSGWIPVFVIASFAVIAILAQLRLDVIGNIFGGLV